MNSSSFTDGAALVALVTLAAAAAVLALDTEVAVLAPVDGVTVPFAVVDVPTTVLPVLACPHAARSDAASAAVAPQHTHRTERRLRRKISISCS